MQEKIIKKNRRKRLAISEIILLITGIIAFSCLLGNSFPVVSAQNADLCTKDKNGNEVRVSTINNVNQWCLENGGSAVCDGGSNNWILRTHACPTEETTKVLSTAIPTLTVIPAARDVWGMLKGKGVLPTLPAAEGFVGPLTPPGWKSPLAGKGFFGRIVERLTFTGKAWEAAAGPLIVAGIVVVAIATYTFISVLIKTGDASRAAEAALRVGIGAGAGALAGYLIVAVVGGPAGWIIGGAAILGALFSSWLKREQDRQIDFMCKPWQAQTGGANCDSCNDNDFPCTEYQCRSLGTGCEIINKDTDEPRCVWKDPKDINPPKIQPWEDALTEGYEYVPLPPVEGTGVEIKYTGEECLPFFQPFTFGVKLDKDGYCKIDFKRTSDFSEMGFDFGGKNLYMKEHTQQMSFPGVVHLEQAGINLTNEGEYEFYVRCEAATNGKANRDEFIFKFCIDPGPDTTSPIIRGFNWLDGAPIAYFEEGETREVNVQVYVNEPSQCKWSHEDKSYENMENNLTCSDDLINFNAQLSYTCTGKLTGLENSKQNKFFFRCNDNFGNVNIQSKTLTLVGTQPLVISSVEPNETTIKAATDSIKVTFEAKTSAGYKQGEATCYYSDTGAPGSYVLFSNTNSYQHSTNIWFGPGNYEYFIRCIDLAGNSDNKQISFTIETDTFAPIIVRVFRDGPNLKIITDEEASCVYDNRDCLYDFDDGIKMTSDDKTHFTEWDPDKNFYIKCQDEFGNQPAPQSCSIIAKPFEV